MANINAPTSTKKIAIGVGLVLLSCLLLALLSAFVKAASNYASPQFILFFQFLISFLLILPMLKKHGGIKTSKLKLHFLRALSGTGASYGLFLSITMIPLTLAVLLVYSAPIWMTLFAWLFFKEKISASMWIGVLIGFIGIGLILHPTVDNVSKGMLLALVGGILMSVALLTIHTLNKTEPAPRILFYYFGFATVISLPVLLYTATDWQSVAAIGWVYIICTGLCQAISQILIVIAYHYATPAKLAPYIYSVILFTAIIDYLIWNQALHTLELVGMICVILGGVLALRHPRQQSQP